MLITSSPSMVGVKDYRLSNSTGENKSANTSSSQNPQLLAATALPPYTQSDHTGAANIHIWVMGNSIVAATESEKTEAGDCLISL
jgi:hypothetical protein